MNFSNRRGSSRPSGRLRPRRSVGTRGGCGDGRGPCACPGEWRFRQGFMLTRWISSPGRGQAQGPLIHPTPPLVPTGRLTSLAAFGRQNSVGAQFIGASPIYRPMARRCAPQADKSAMRTINRHLRNGRIVSSMGIISPVTTLPVNFARPVSIKWVCRDQGRCSRLSGCVVFAASFPAGGGLRFPAPGQLLPRG